MVAPGDPELASSLAQRAASVSHDGEAIYAAQVIAAMDALAFIEPDLDRLLDAAVGFIPADCLVYRLIADLREWHSGEADWRVARQKLAAQYGYEVYPGNCHIIPNHGLVILSLLWGEDDFQKSLTIVNTCGWDTDCNSGNVGCLLGIKNGLAGIDAGQDWRSPLADRMLVISADGGEAITDAVREASKVANLGRALAGEAPLLPKGGARFPLRSAGIRAGFLRRGRSRSCAQAGKRIRTQLPWGTAAWRCITICRQAPGSYAPLPPPSSFRRRGACPATSSWLPRPCTPGRKFTPPCRRLRIIFTPSRAGFSLLIMAQATSS